MNTAENSKPERKYNPRVPMQEQEYWEKSSYMLGVNAAQELPVKECEERIHALEGIRLIDFSFDEKEFKGTIRVSFKGSSYEAGFHWIEFDCPPIDEIKSQYMTEKEKETLQAANSAVVVNMDFSGDPTVCYLVQLKLIAALVPEAAGVLDESAEMILSPRFLRMMKNSSVPPSPEMLYTVQSVASESKEVWLHTHGLARCGVTELEILGSDLDNDYDHYRMLKVAAACLLNLDESEKDENAYYIGRLSDGSPIVFTLLPWNEAIWEYGKLEVGGLPDREESHNTLSSCIFLYTSEENEKNGIRSKVSIYNGLWDDNPMYLISTRETARMEAAARDSFGIVEKFGLSEGNSTLIKIGLPTDTDTDEEIPDREHLWFELKGFEEDGFRAELTQEPYYISGLHEGDTALYSRDQVTDWIMYTPEYTIGPGNCYIFMDE